MSFCVQSFTCMLKMCQIPLLQAAKFDQLVNQSDVSSSHLTAKQKYDILKKYYASSDFSLDEKKALRAKVFENDDSDAGKNVQKVLEYSLPDGALKQRLWDEITDPASTDSLMEVRLKIQGFWQRH